MATRMNFKERRKLRREEAEARNAETAKLTPQQRLTRLRERGYGHTREAKELEAALAKAS